MEINGDCQVWRDFKVPGFDTMVSEDQLFPLCVLIGNAVFKQTSQIVGFEGPASSGKSVMCDIIGKVARENGIHTIAGNGEPDGDFLQQAMRLSNGICFYEDSGLPHFIRKAALIPWRDSENIRLGFWKMPTFFCSNVAIEYKNVHVIRFAQATQPNPKLLDSINIELVKTKCLLAVIAQTQTLD